MKREIKFRAWINNGVVHKMFYSHEIHIKSDAADGFLYNVGFVDSDPNNNRIEQWQKDIVWMQFTGLHDKNGQEIYEGDIIKRHTGKSIDKELAKIVYFNGAFCLTGVKDGIGGIIAGKCPLVRINRDLMDAGIDKDASDVLEVIGNIYENPELLK